eukprot:GHVU01052390.1.p1 GENE.GHVU01052390.1~~GHVU01052390.1.p1  ORF type:complete len:104 (+),score=7.61 GHVU01052390.1:252-563(+)
MISAAGTLARELILTIGLLEKSFVVTMNNYSQTKANAKEILWRKYLCREIEAKVRCQAGQVIRASFAAKKMIDREKNRTMHVNALLKLSWSSFLGPALFWSTS